MMRGCRRWVLVTGFLALAVLLDSMPVLADNSGQYPTYVTANVGIYGYWRLDDATTASAVDSGAQGFNGTYYGPGVSVHRGTCAVVTTGDPGTATCGSMHISDHISGFSLPGGTMPGGTAFGFFGEWVNPADLSCSRGQCPFMWANGDPSARPVSMTWCSICGGATGINVVIEGTNHPTGVTISASSWHFLVVGYDGAGSVTLWVDGASAWTYSATVGDTINSFTVGSAVATWDAIPGDYSELMFGRGSIDTATVHHLWLMGSTGSIFEPGPNPFGTPGQSSPGVPTIAEVAPQDCGTPSWTDPSGYFPWFGCQIHNIMGGVLNPVIRVLNFVLGFVAWFFDFSVSIDVTPLSTLANTAKTRFPFSVPFDIAGILGPIFGTSATAPTFDLPMHAGGHDYNMTVDLTWMNPLQSFVRWGELALFVVGAGMAVRKWSGGGW